MTDNQIPYEISRICGGVSVDKVAKMMKNGELTKKAEAGKCRFCGKHLGVTHIKVHLVADQPPADYPVLQCARVANLWPQANRKVEMWLEQERRERQALAEQAKKNAITKEF